MVVERDVDFDHLPFGVRNSYRLHLARPNQGFWLGFGAVGWFFFFMAHRLLDFLDLHSNMLVTQQIIDEIQRSMERTQRTGYVRQTADELSVLLFAVLAGFACRW